MGSHELINTQVLKVNGESIRSLAHVKELVEAGAERGDESILFELKDKRLLVIDAKGSYSTAQRSTGSLEIDVHRATLFMETMGMGRECWLRPYA